MRKEDEPPSGDIRLQWLSLVLQYGFSIEVRSDASPEHAQRVKDKLVLGYSLVIGVVPGSLTNETIPCLQSGHAIEPGGLCGTVELLLVEHKYNAH